MSHPPLGFIVPSQRTQAQADAHAKALAKMPRFSLSGGPKGDPPVGTKVILTKFWSNPDVIADVGFEFTGFHQLTGSCVGVSDGNCVFTLGSVQRTIADAPTKAFVPFWPFNYGRTRYLEGDRGQGEGAVDSVMFQQNGEEGVLAITEQGLPTFDRSDGLALTSHQELQYSDGASQVVTSLLPLAKPHLVGTRAILSNTIDVRDAIINGYPVLDGVSMFCQHGSIKGSGDNAYAVGRYDGSGGHSTCLLGFWQHPNDGPLFLYSNQWPASTYPKDPAGGGRCTVWLPESEVAKIWTRLGGEGEIAALSHLAWFPAQPSVMDWSY